MKPCLTRLALTFGTLAALLVVAIIWTTERSESRIQSLVSEVRGYETIDEVIALLGEPYGIYHEFPPKLGKDLIEFTDNELNVAVFAFVVKRMPPNFITVKVSKPSGEILAVGTAKS